MTGWQAEGRPAASPGSQTTNATVYQESNDWIHIWYDSSSYSGSPRKTTLGVVQASRSAKLAAVW